jgi:rfaE bifunctional protein nucleotidyltransferase chain/domain
MKKIWINGTFDIIHIGHIKLFEYAKSVGDYIVVGIDSDKRVKYLKGQSRPINNQDDRRELLLAIKYINEVHIFNSDEELSELIKKSNSDIMIIGDDYIDKNVIGSQHVKQLLFFKKIEGYSTTNIIKQLC